MKKIIPYTSYEEAMEAFDNGGKFYDLFSHAHDGVVSPAELGKVAGVTNDKQSLILYLVMSISRLDNRARERVLAKLSTQLFEIYQKYHPVHMSLDQLIDHGKAGISTTVVGSVQKVISSAHLSGSILVPMIVGAVSSFTMVPIEESYEVYELSSGTSDRVALVAHHQEKERLPERKLRLGGMLTTLNLSDDAKDHQSIFLEAQYYIEED